MGEQNVRTPKTQFVGNTGVPVCAAPAPPATSLGRVPQSRAHGLTCCYQLVIKSTVFFSMTAASLRGFLTFKAIL